MPVKSYIKKNKNLLDHFSEKIGIDFSYLIEKGNWVSLRFLILSLSGLLLSVSFAKFGSKELLGQYQLILSVTSIVSICSLLGLNTAALEAVVRGRDAAVLRASRFIFLFSLIGVPILAGIGLFHMFFRGDILLGWTFIFSSLSFPFFYSLSTWSTYYEGRLLFKESSLRVILLNITLTIFLIGGIIFGLNVLGLVVLFFLINIIFQGSFLFGIFREIKDKKNNYVDTHFGLAISFQKFFSALSTTLPPLVISYFFGIESLAVYFIAFYIISALSSFLGNLFSLYLPVLFKGVNLNHRSIIINNFLAGMVTLVVFIIFLKYFFVRIYGEDYSDSLKLAYSISLLLLFIPLHTYLVGFFSTKRKNRLLISVFVAANIVGFLVMYFMSSLGFYWSVTAYLYILEIITTLPLLGYYVYYARGDQRI